MHFPLVGTFTKSFAISFALVLQHFYLFYTFFTYSCFSAFLSVVSTIFCIFQHSCYILLFL
jgi:hypothetical protein